MACGVNDGRVEKPRSRQPAGDAAAALLTSTSQRCVCGTSPRTRAAAAPSTSATSSTWCAERGLTEPVEVTRPVLERYQRHLFHYRKSDGEPLSFRSAARTPGRPARSGSNG